MYTMKMDTDTLEFCGADVGGEVVVVRCNLIFLAHLSEYFRKFLLKNDLPICVPNPTATKWAIDMSTLIVRQLIPPDIIDATFLIEVIIAADYMDLRLILTHLLSEQSLWRAFNGGLVTIETIKAMDKLIGTTVDFFINAQGYDSWIEVCNWPKRFTLADVDNLKDSTIFLMIKDTKCFARKTCVDPGVDDVIVDAIHRMGIDICDAAEMAENVPDGGPLAMAIGTKMWEKIGNVSDMIRYGKCKDLFTMEEKAIKALLASKHVIKLESENDMAWLLDNFEEEYGYLNLHKNFLNLELVSLGRLITMLMNKCSDGERGECDYLVDILMQRSMGIKGHPRHDREYTAIQNCYTGWELSTEFPVSAILNHPGLRQYLFGIALTITFELHEGCDITVWLHQPQDVEDLHVVAMVTLSFNGVQQEPFRMMPNGKPIGIVKGVVNIQDGMVHATENIIIQIIRIDGTDVSPPS
jgi:hypothetical protein